MVKSGIIQTRSRKQNIGAGKNRTTVTDYWEVIDIKGLTTAGFYGPLGSGSHKKSI